MDCQTINVCCQDAHNFLWFGTEDNGLRRFDGTQFVTYHHSNTDSLSLANDKVLSLLIDNSNQLWIGTGNGLQRYVSESDNFQTVRLNGMNFGGYITSIIQRKDGEILFVVSGMGLFRLDTKTMTGYKVETANKTWHSRYLYNLYEDSRERLWLGTDREGLIRIDLDTKEEKLYSLPSTTIKDISEDKNGQLYIVTNYTVYRLDETTDRLMPLSYQGKQKDLYFTRSLTTTDGKIVIGTGGNGLLQISSKDMTFTDFPLYNPFINTSQARITCLFEDHQKNLWIGSQYQGMLMYPNIPMPFHFTNKPSLYSKTPGRISALYYNKKGMLWCSVENDGIYQLNNDETIVNYIAVPHTAGAMYEDSEGTYWIGVNGQGLYTLNPKTNQLQLKYPIKGDYVISSLTEDKHKNLYVSVMGEGILRYHLPTGKFQMFTYQTPFENQAELVNFWISYIYCDSKERLWTCHHGGISCYDLEKQAFIRLPFREWVRKSAYCILEDKNQQIWIGTQSGLLCYNPQTEEYQAFTTAQGLPTNIISGIAEDEKGGLWCSTSQGIAYLSPDRQKITNYYTGNGLEDKTYLNGCFAQAKNGTICFGGEKGITRFNPTDIHPIQQNKTLCITEMYIRNQKVTRQTRSGGKPVIKQDMVDADYFYLSNADNNFTFHVSTMDFNDARNVIYEYKINELEKTWNQTRPGEGRILYPHLPSGNYTLQIRAYENSVYSPVKSVKIHIAYPWYLSTYAYLLYFILIMGVGYLLYLSIKRKQREKIGEMKLQFFINIAHEIRSPLTLIVTPLEKLLKQEHDEKTQKALLTIRYNANRILNLLNQLLDIRRIDKGQMQLHLVETDLRTFVNELLDVFYSQAQQKNIQLNAEFAENLPSVWIDPTNFDKVLVNLLTNALKYTSAGGEICVSIHTGYDSTSTGPLREYIELTVSDTGRGLNEKELKRIFERFYQSGTNQAFAPLGFGIGLNLCQLLVKLHHGVIFAENRKDVQGSRFVVRLPLGCKHLKKKEISETEPVHTVKSPAQIECEISIPNKTQEKAEKPHTNYRVLIIDDDTELRNFLAENLSANYRIDTAMDGDEGYKKAVTEQPDIIISDVIMPKKNGLQMLKELKKNVNTNHIPVILLTSKTELANRMEGLTQGADGYLGKPFNMEELDTLIINLITNRIRLQKKYTGMQIQDNKVSPSSNTPNYNEQLMERIMKVINENLSNPQLNIETLAQEIGISRTQLYRSMKEITGLNPSDFVRTIRLRQAAELLKDKNLNITQVAYSVGFSSQTHFSSAFKKQYGISPTEYKEKHKE